ncbi:MAG TPA: alanine--tRNA ligase [Oligoflexia bacterium]|nr:alanine--tRNA ligase [Oligoflexia bacterium]HMP48157.1 alanine--tRNA ligase [Oligoflexia bacterium]
MKTEEIRESFLRYFETKGHTRVQSSSLVPAGDPTLLFTNSGMVPFKDVFLGTEQKPYNRATTCQKSLRISGKHNDLENVGRTARHHTFFEMLGNFSFGDYFKKDAISFAWEFVVKELKLSRDRLWVTVFEEDDEARTLWLENTDINASRILPRGKEDNFWAMGETGPCGPSSEIFYFLGPDEYQQKGEELLVDDPRYVEIWNLVFMQFSRDAKGVLSNLPKPSIDTGMGLERVAAVVQGKMSNYDTDLLKSIINFTAEKANVKYIGEDYTERDPATFKQYGIDVALRVIADHARACCFLIAEGILPASDGRGYVLRRLVRRACRHGRVLGFTSSFLHEVSGHVIRLMGEAYPELLSEAEKIKRTLKNEEEKFLQTFDSGVNILEKEVSQLRKTGRKVLPGEIAFQLHDTFGFPLDLTNDLLRHHGCTVDEDGFSREMETQRERSRSARSGQTTLLLQRSVKPQKTQFVGYDYLEYESSILGLYAENGETKIAKEGDEIALVTLETPFYAESGGQVGDSGRISSSSGSLDVLDTQKAGGDTITHICRVIDGNFQAGDKVRLSVDSIRRGNIRIHHSATHVLHLALREVLGPHVKQAGSRVSEASLRFDFSHDHSVLPEQLSEIEAFINEYILRNHEARTMVLPIEEAKTLGAVALFGEKYGDRVRVVELGVKSREFCGGTHVTRTGDIGSVFICGETSVSAGVRRIEALAGMCAFRASSDSRSTIQKISGILQSGESALVEKLTRLIERNRELEREQGKLVQASLSQYAQTLAEQVKISPKGRKIISAHIDGASPEQLRIIADDLRDRLGSACIGLASVIDGKAVFLAAVTKDLTGTYNAGNLLKQTAEVLGARGGGKVDLAQAGGGNPDKIPEALSRFESLI